MNACVHFLHWFYSAHFTNDNLVALFEFQLTFLMNKIRIIKCYFGKRYLCHRNSFDENYPLPKAKNVIGFHWVVWFWWMRHFQWSNGCLQNRKLLIGNQKAKQILKEICQTLGNVQNSFHSAFNAFLECERKHDEIMGTVELGGVQWKLWDQIVRIIVFLKRWSLHIEHEFWMETKDKKAPRHQKMMTKHLILFNLGELLWPSAALWQKL